MDGLRGERVTHKHTYAVTQTHAQVHNLLTFLEKVEPLVRCVGIKLQKMAGDDEKRLDHWFMSSNCAEWQFLLGRKLWLNPCLGASTFRVKQEDISFQQVMVCSSNAEAKDCWQIIFMKYIQIRLLTGKPVPNSYIGWIYTEQITLISTDPDRCVLSAETSLWLWRQ